MVAKMPHAIENTGAAFPNMATRVLTYQSMQEAVDVGATCADCNRLLLVIWGGNYGCNCYLLSCGDMTHAMTKRIGRKTKEQIEGEKVFRGYSLKLLKEYTPTEMVARAATAGIFPQTMTQPQRQAIAQVCIEYGLDPLMNELMIYQGRPYVTMAARLRKAQEAGDFAGISTRAATVEEKESRGYRPEDHVMLAEARKVIGGVVAGPFQGWGVVKKTTADRADKHLPISDNPAQHAEKRAIARALRMAWHLPLPTAEDIGAEDGNGAQKPYDVEGDAKDVTEEEGPAAAQMKAAHAKAKAKATGKAESPPAAATAAPADEATGNGKPKNGAPLVIPPTNYGELKAIVHARQPDVKLADIDSWIVKAVGMDSDGVQADPAAAYNELKTLCGWEPAQE